MRRPSPTQRTRLVLLGVLSCFSASLSCFSASLSYADEPLATLPAAPTSQAAPQPAVFEAARSYGYLQALCALGNRKSGSPGMKQQQTLLQTHFENLGAGVAFQRFKANHPLTGKRVPMANLIVTWNPEAKQRILFCAHYDTRPLPDRETNPYLRKNGVFLGANDGASGVALLMELGHHLPQLPKNYGVDFVLFDGEELVYFDGQRDLGEYFAGSTWFARQYQKNPPAFQYVAGVLLDMVADARLSLYQETHSVTWKETRPLVQEIWGTAQQLGIEEFIPRAKYEVRDDHLPLYHIAKIPVIDVIDFQYPDPQNRYWHTTADAPGRCSADSLGKVGTVLLAWLSAKE
jgi:hypothetical protein